MVEHLKQAAALRKNWKYGWVIYGGITSYTTVVRIV